MQDAYEQLRNIDICTVNKANLVEITNVKVDNTLVVAERKKDFIQQILNPYCFLCNGIIVKTSYAKNGTDFAQDIRDYVKSKFDTKMDS